MTSSHRVVRLAVAGFAALALTACGGVHPGAAAVVDGQSISMARADDASTAYCELSLASAGQQGQAIATAEVRRQAVSDLVLSVIAEQIATDRSLNLDPAGYALTEAQHRQIEQAFPRADTDEIAEVIERSQRINAIVLAVGEAVSGTKITAKTGEDEQNSIRTAGQDELVKAYKASDVAIDPRFGLADLTKQVAATGSLSVPQSTEAVDPATLPVSQRCS